MFKTWRKVDRNSSIWTWREKFPSRAVAAHHIQLCRNRFLRAEVVSVDDASFDDMLCGRYYRTLSAANCRMFSICATVCWQKKNCGRIRAAFFSLISNLKHFFTPARLAILLLIIRRFFSRRCFPRNSRPVRGRTSQFLSRVQFLSDVSAVLEEKLPPRRR